MVATRKGVKQNKCLIPFFMKVIKSDNSVIHCGKSAMMPIVLFLQKNMSNLLQLKSDLVTSIWDIYFVTTTIIRNFCNVRFFLSSMHNKRQNTCGNFRDCRFLCNFVPRYAKQKNKTTLDHTSWRTIVID